MTVLFSDRSSDTQVIPGGDTVRTFDVSVFATKETVQIGEETFSLARDIVLRITGEISVIDTSDYQALVIGTPNGRVYPRVQITFSTAFANDTSITVERGTEITQETEFRASGKFNPLRHEDNFDKLTMISQEQQEELDDIEGRLGTQEGHDVDTRLDALESDSEINADTTRNVRQDARLDALETDALINADTTRNERQDADIATLKTEQATQNKAIAANTARQTEISANTTRSMANTTKDAQQDTLIAANTARQTEISANTTRSTANAAKNVQQDRRLDKVEDGFMQGAGPIPLVCAVKHNNELTNEPTPNGNTATNSPAFPTGFGIDFTTKMATGLTTPIDPDTIAVGEVPDNFFSNWMNSSSTFVSEYRARKTEFDLYVVYVHGDPVNDKGATGYGVPDIRPAFAEKADQDVVIVQSTGVPASIVMQAWVNSVEFAAINLVLDTYGLKFTNAGLVASTETGIVDPRHADQGGFVRGLAEIPTDQEKNRLVEFTLGVPSGTAFEPAVVYELRALESTLRTVDRLSPTELRQQRRSPYTDGTPVWRPIREANIRPIITGPNLVPRIEIDVIGENIGTGVRGVDLLPINNIIRRFQQTRWHGDIFFIYGMADDADGGFRNYKVSLVIDHTLYTQGNPRTFRIIRSKSVAVRADTFIGVDGLQTSRSGLRTEFDLNRFTNEFQLDPDIDARISAMDFAPGNVGIQMYLQVEPDDFDSGQVHFDGMFSVTTRDKEGVWTGAEFIFDQLADNVLLGDAAVFNAPVPHSIYIQVDAAAGGATPAAPPAPSNLIMQLDDAGQPTEENPAESLRTTDGDPLTSVMAGGVAFSPEPKAHVAGKFLFKYTGFARPTATNKRISEVIEYSVGIPQTGEADLPIRRLYFYLAIADGDAIQATLARSFNLSTQTSPNVVAVPSPTATQRVVRYSRDFTNAEQRSDAANTATSWTFTNPVIVNAIDGRAGPSQTTPRDVLRYPSESTVIAEDHTVVADDGGRMIQGPKVGDASEQEGGTLVVRREDGSVAGAGNARTVVDLLPTASKETVITERMFHEITLSTPFAKIENNLYVPLFDEIRLFFGSGPAIDSEQVIVLDLYRMRFQADTVTRNEYVKLISRPYNNTAGSRIEIELNRQGTDPNFAYDFLRLYLSEDSAFSQGSNKLLEVLGIKYNEEILPAPVFSYSAQWPIPTTALADIGGLAGVLNSYWDSSTKSLGSALVQLITDGATSKTIDYNIENFARRENSENRIAIYYGFEGIYEDFPRQNLNFYFRMDGDALIDDDGNFQGTIEESQLINNNTMFRKRRFIVAVLAATNPLPQLIQQNDAVLGRLVELAQYPMDEGAYRFVTWGRASTHGDATAMYGIDPGRPIQQSFASSTLFESPREHTKTTSPNQAEIEGRQVLSLRPNRWHFGNQFSDGEIVYFGVEPHIRLPHTLFVPDVYNNNIDNDNTHNRIKIFFPWVDLEKLESITLAAQGLPTATLWHRTTVLDDPFFKLVRVEPSADTRWVEMALLESTLATGSGYVGTHLQMNLVGDA